MQELDLRASRDLVCDNLLCEKVGEPCICRLSRVLERLPALLRLDLSGNGLVGLPDSICALQQLQHLDLSGNNIQQLPCCLWRMPALQCLDVRSNAALLASRGFLEHSSRAAFQIIAK